MSQTTATISPLTISRTAHSTSRYSMRSRLSFRRAIPAEKFLEPIRFRWDPPGSFLTRFLNANRFPPPDQVRGHASLENAFKALRPLRAWESHPQGRRPGE